MQSQKIQPLMELSIAKPDLNINEVTDIYLLIKGIVENSRRVYVVSMNAMLCSRNIAGMDSGFLMVSSQLRDFSTKLTLMMESMKIMMATISAEVALNLKLQRNIVLIERTCEMSNTRHVFTGVNKLLRQQELIEASRTRLSYAARQLRLMTRLGINLVVLARVESQGGGTARDTLGSIIDEMEQAMVTVECRISNVQKIVA